MCSCSLLIGFFFFKQKTAYEMRISDWSSDVCSSDLVHPMALSVLNGLGFDTAGMRSKSWDEFAVPDAPQFDFIFTVCDNAAGETCPVWIGHPMTAHWGNEDPADFEGDEQREAFMQALRYLQNPISLFPALPLDSIHEMAMVAKPRQLVKNEH